jgi:allene oxide cyclase
MTRTRKIAGTVAVAIAGLTVFTLNASAKTSTGRSATIHLVERGGSLRFVDNAPKAKHPYDFSPGDIVIVSREVTDTAGKPAGSLRLVCIATTAAEQQCSGTEALATGTLEVAGISAHAPATTVAITGGTGTYAGARGTSVSRDRPGNSDVSDQTISLAP